MCSAIVCGFVTGDALVSYWPIFYFLQLALDKRRSERLPTVHCDCVSDKMAEFSIALSDARDYSFSKVPYLERKEEVADQSNFVNNVT